MKNDLLTIGKFTIHGYGLMIAIGVIAAYMVGDYRAKKKGLDQDKLFNMVVIGVIMGFVGSKLLYYITVLPDIIKDPKLLLNFADGFVVYGGIIGGVAAGYLYCKKQGLKFLQYFDLAAPSIALAQGFGRIGCLLAGCCYGLEASCPISIVFHESQFAPNGVPLIPTQIISSGLNFIHFLILIWFSKHVKADGQVSALYLIFYSIGRFVLEFFRGDLVRGSVGALSTSQFISLFICAAGIVLFLVSGRMQKRGEENK